MAELSMWISEDLVEDAVSRREAWALRLNDLFKAVEELTDEQLDDLRCVKITAVPARVIQGPFGAHRE